MWTHFYKDTFNYKKANERMKAYYYDGEVDSKIKQAIKKLQNDNYIGILDLYYKEYKTLENIAEIYNIQQYRTILENKKRLLRKIFWGDKEIYPYHPPPT